MKKFKQKLGISLLLVTGFILVAADHIDAPAVRGESVDIADYFVFQGENTDNIVFIATVQALLSPAATLDATFDENVMIEFNIDTTGDNIEDLVIQAIPKGNKMYFTGPVAPSQTGLISTFEGSTGQEVSSVKITPYGDPATISTSKDGLTFFAGPRDDPFFFDFAQYSAIIAGNATSFNNPGSDTFAGTNVLSIAVEVPKTMIGNSGTINTWVETKRKQ